MDMAFPTPRASSEVLGGKHSLSLETAKTDEGEAGEANLTLDKTVPQARRGGRSLLPGPLSRALEPHLHL